MQIGFKKADSTGNVDADMCVISQRHQPCISKETLRHTNRQSGAPWGYVARHPSVTFEYLK